MCGICGKISFGHESVKEQTLRNMAEKLVHRGPDGEGYYLSRDKKAGFGHRRLAIIDLKGGSQPMANENKKVWIVFNGEIYNFLELKTILVKKGHVFRTKSDTEVILHLFEKEYQIIFIYFSYNLHAFSYSGN